MSRKRYSDEDVLKLLREIDVHLLDGLDVVSACRKAGISDKSYYYWRKKFASIHASVHNHLNSKRSLSKRSTFKLNRDAALTEWRSLIAA